MKRYLHIILMFLFFLTGNGLGAQELDSLKRKALSDKLDEYLETLKYEPVDVQKRECDFLIESSTDSLVRQFVAQKIYDHYITSRQMGVEAVAIHVLDRWFIPGKVKMADEFDFIDAKVYADFNRQSQIGCKAPELTMQDIDGRTVRLFGDDGQKEGRRFTVLYFYDTDCSKCSVETILLRSVIEDNDYPIDFYAIYVGDRKEAWKEYVSEKFDYRTSRTSVSHLWDPQIESDFQKKYGLLQTPRLFLVTPDGVIAGRGLDARALQIMLMDQFREVELNYGDSQSEGIFKEILSEGTDSAGTAVDAYVDKAVRLADYITDATLPKGDTVMFRQLSGDFLYYLSSRSDEGSREALEYLIDKNILSRSDVWKTKDDSLKVVGFAQIMDDLLSKSSKGSRIADLKVPGEMLSGKKCRKGTFRLPKLKGKENIILFFTEGCEVCKAEKAMAAELTENSAVKVLMVNVDEVLASDPAMAEKLFNTFDLSSLPHLIVTDRKGTILRRYISLKNFSPIE